MGKKIKVVIGSGLSLLLAGLIAADLYVSGQIKTLLGSTQTQNEAVNEAWKQLQSERLGTVLFSVVIFLIVLIIVLKVGSEKAKEKRVSQKEALQIAAEMMEDYKKRGIFVEARDEEEYEEDVITEMAMPKMKAVRFEGDKVVVEWNPVPKATGYYVWRKQGEDDWVKIKKIKKAVCKYKDLNIQEKTRYTYAIKSYYEAEGIRVISKKDPLGMDIYISKVNTKEGAEV